MRGNTYRRGIHTSEFLVIVLNAIGNIVAAMTGQEASPQAAKYTSYGVLAYAISRGLSKLTVGNPEAPALNSPVAVPTTPLPAPPASTPS